MSKGEYGTRIIKGLPEREYYRRYAEENRFKINARSSAYQKRTGEVRRKKLLSLLGDIVCRKCGFSDWRALQIDHINGGGGKERKEVFLRQRTRHYGMLRLIQKDSSKYQILCANCNWIKKYENNENYVKN